VDDIPCPQSVPESGYEGRNGGKTGIGPHLAYNAGGLYIKAAACYINEKYEA
jgi:hypothetical protein